MEVLFASGVNLKTVASLDLEMAINIAIGVDHLLHGRQPSLLCIVAQHTCLVWYAEENQRIRLPG